MILELTIISQIYLKPNKAFLILVVEVNLKLFSSIEGSEIILYLKRSLLIIWFMTHCSKSTILIKLQKVELRSK